MKPSKPRKTPLTIVFRAKLSQVVLPLPKAANAKILEKGKVTVEGIVNYSPFRAALEPDGDGSRQLAVSKAMSDAIGAVDGDTVTVEITRVDNDPEIRVPSDLQRALAKNPRAKGSWADITPMARRDWIFSICTAKQAETRQRRIDKACDMLAGGKRRLCCFPGIKWMMKENADICGMWLPLPGRK